MIGRAFDAALGGLPLAVIDNATGAPVMYAVHTDHLGTPRVMTDATGAEVWRISARPFGETVAITGAASNDNRFPGQVFDAESGLNYNYFRDYDPSLGRYLQSDPIGLRGGLNTYAYVGGNPVTRVDPLGLQTAVPMPGVGPAPFAPIVIPGTPQQQAWQETSQQLGRSLEQSIASRMLTLQSIVRLPQILLNEEVQEDPEQCVPEDAGEKKPAKVKNPPDTSQPNDWVEGPRRGRQYGPDGRPAYDIDRPHQGMPDWHVHEWNNGVREHPGRPVSPVGWGE